VKTALIMGITAQDESFLAELLLTKGDVVHGTYGGAVRWLIDRMPPYEIYSAGNSSGKPIRFYQAGSSEMFAAAALPPAFHPMRHYDDNEIIHAGAGEDLTIAESAEPIRRAVGYTGRIAFDAGKPEGTPRELLDVTKLHASGWRARIGIQAGIRQTYERHPAHAALAANR
jgi:GDP-L-fucose synthase